MPADPQLVEAIATRLIRRLDAAPDQALVVGICGPQGSGKSTVSADLAADLGRAGIETAVLSIDDIYLTKAERERLGETVHPLFRTRGVPGTHDVAIGLSVVEAVAGGRAVRLPRFDKAVDDRGAQDAWPWAPPGTRVLILEGWCVGARPQDEAALAEPVNALERDEDPDGRWRRHANARLGGDYQALFARLDLLVLLAAPGFEIVHRWRLQQEHALRAATGGGMSDAAVARFIAHYERLTRHILSEMPDRADLVARLDEDRHLRAIEGRDAAL